MSTDRRARRHEGTRREILGAAWELADRDGISGLSLRELATAVGMRAPSLYTYFEGKDALFDAMFAQGYREMDERADGWVVEVEGLESVEALGLVARRFVEFCQESVARYQIMFTRAVPGWQPSPEAYAVSMTSYERSAEYLARVGIEDPSHRDLYTAVVSGLAAQQMANDPKGDRWARLAPVAMEMLLRQIAVERRSEG